MVLGRETARVCRAQPRACCQPDVAGANSVEKEKFSTGRYGYMAWSSIPKET